AAIQGLPPGFPHHAAFDRGLADDGAGEEEGAAPVCDPACDDRHRADFCLEAGHRGFDAMASRWHLADRVTANRVSGRLAHVPIRGDHPDSRPRETLPGWVGDDACERARLWWGSQ